MNDKEFESTYCRRLRERCSHYRKVFLGKPTLKDMLVGIATRETQNKNACDLCKNDNNFRINFISGMNCTSSYATFDFGLIDDIQFCPRCGRKL